MIKFPSIDQFRNCIKAVSMQSRYVGKDADDNPIYDASKKLPTLKFRGTVKLHGSNAGIVLTGDELSYQSRERVLSLEFDNAGFMLYMKQREAAVRAMMNCIRIHANAPDATVAVFGEWCGQGIQSGVAISQVPKCFVMFAIKVNDDWQDMSEFEELQLNDHRIFNIMSFDTYEVDIDFGYPELVNPKLVAITEAVEAECPVGKYFDISGIGEGVVWECIEVGYLGHRFKVKGEKHSVSKVKTLAPVDVEAITKIKDFVESVVTEARLMQGLDNLQREQLKPFEMTSMGDFIRWVFNDVMKEEEDTIIASGLDAKKLGGPIANVARPWYIKKYNESTGILV